MQDQFRRVYQVEFAPGPLGLSLQPQYISHHHQHHHERTSPVLPPPAFPLVVVLRCLPHQQAEESGKISPGDLLIKVNKVPVEQFGEYSQLVAHLRALAQNSPETAEERIVLEFTSTQRLNPRQRRREKILARTRALEQALERKPQVQLDEIREFAKSGIVSERHRALVWKLLLGVLPKDVARWEAVGAENAQIYSQYCEEMFSAHKYDALNKSNEEVQEEDGYEHVSDILNEDILKDVSRTHPNYHFFTCESTLRMMHRILYIYGKLNSGVAYVQGMNEILAPIVYVFAAHKDSNLETCEADSFFCFASLMSDVRDLFIRHLDGETSGLHGTLKRFDDLLMRVDSEVAIHLQSEAVLTQFFAVRPLTTLLTREFELPDVFRLWDALLGRSKKRFHFVMCCLAALITTKRDFLLASDFPTCLKSLQAPCTVPVHLIVREAERIAAVDAALPADYVPPAASAAHRGDAAAATTQRVEELALDMFRSMSRFTRGVVEDAKVAINELKNAANNQQQQQQQGAGGGGVNPQ